MPDGASRRGDAVRALVLGAPARRAPRGLAANPCRVTSQALPQDVPPAFEKTENAHYASPAFILLMCPPVVDEPA
eukprot:10543532-Prorocentrum_lima.AAC.1